jgi:hypothetical protein
VNEEQGHTANAVVDEDLPKTPEITGGGWELRGVENHTMTLR